MAVGSRSAARRLYVTLRSPRLAIRLLVLLGIYLVAAAAVPQRSIDPAEVVAWSARNPFFGSLADGLGLHDAFTRPVFLLLVAMLAATTGVCAWDRTARAIGLIRGRGLLDRGTVAALRSSPMLRLELPTGREDAVYERVLAALSGLHLKVRSGPAAGEASSGWWGLLGSPFFHWALLGLIVAAPLGALTKSEGLIGIVAGYEKPDMPESYGLFESGPLHAGTSGMLIGVEPEMPLTHVVRGVDYGPAPIVVISDGERVVARGEVYPNSPLRFGSRSVHLSDHGLGAVIALRSGGETVLLSQILIDRDDSQDSGWGSATETYVDDQGREVASLRVTPLVDETGTARIEITDRVGESETRVMRVGEEIAVMPGVTARVEHLGSYARLSVVDDASIPLIYACLFVASIAVGVSVLVPHRVVRVLRDTEPDGRQWLLLSATHSRGDRGFVERVREAAVQAAGVQEAR
ncbi:MAG: cytochrome c biogenesis protein ResB [Coriobacteriia bacterium]|nr:cytochrome c biogenesis protein ResB [Coriobacteriia bacterium]